MNNIINAINDNKNKSHTVVIGPTGSGKTNNIVIPSVKVLADAGENMIINDSKEEIYKKLSGYLYKKGYNIILINFRNPNFGNSWNMFQMPYSFYINGDIDKAYEFANDIANYLTVSDGTGDDPFWNNSASSLLFGLIILLFKYCKEYNISVEYVNINNILELKNNLFSDLNRAKHTQIWKYAQKDKIIKNNLSGIIYAPVDTANSILSVLDSCLRTLSIQPSLSNMLCFSDFEMEEITKTKTAIFAITHDEKKDYQKIESLFFSQCYDYIVFANRDRNHKRVNFILDDLTSSLPYLKGLESMILSARHRGIKFLLAINSKNSLDSIYENESETIISNCTNLILLPNRDIKLFKDFYDFLKLSDKENFKNPDKDNNEALIIIDNGKPMISIIANMYSHLDFGIANIIKYKKRPQLDDITIDFIFNNDLDRPTPRDLDNKLEDIISEMNKQINKSNF